MLPRITSHYISNLILLSFKCQALFASQSRVSGLSEKRPKSICACAFSVNLELAEATASAFKLNLAVP